MLSQLFLLSQCAFHDFETLVERKIVHSHKNVSVHRSALRSSMTIGHLSHHTIVDTLPYNNSHYVYISKPLNGFAMAKSFKTVQSFNISTFCPLMGWRDENNIRSSCMYAPTALVIAQQLWNAAQVMHLSVVVLLFFVLKRSLIMINWKHKTIFVCISMLYMIATPFTIIVTSPAAFWFCMYSVLLSLSTIYQFHDIELMVKVCSKKHISTKQCIVVREEMLGFICNLCSSLYNYNASRLVWPHWNRIYRQIDWFFDLNGKENAYLNSFDSSFYTTGRQNVYVPTYVPTSHGSTTGARLFVFLWTFMPFLYLAYLLCMYLLANNSPYFVMQRAFICFAMFHFLFMTDVVSYKYGRGLCTPLTELFHWFERYSWRIAVLTPIYQNLSNGHWKHGHSNQLLANVICCIVFIWALMFIVFHVLFNDTISFVRFLNGLEIKTVFDLYDIDCPSVLGFCPFSYHGGLVVTICFYLFLMIAGFESMFLTIEVIDPPTNKK